MAIITKGFGAMKESLEKTMDNFKLKSGESRIIRFLTPDDEIITVDEHMEQFNGQWQNVTCIGKLDCPLCKVGSKPSFKAYFSVLDKTEDKVKIFKTSKTLARQIVGMIEEYGDITARDYKITRNGEALATTYQLFPRDPKKEDLSIYELPNIEALVQPMDKADLVKLVEGYGIPKEGATTETYSETTHPF